MAARKRIRDGQPGIAVIIHCSPGQEVSPKLVDSLRRQTLPPSEFEILLFAEPSDATLHFGEAELAEVTNLRWQRDSVADQMAVLALSLRLTEAPVFALLDPKAAATAGWLSAYGLGLASYGEVAQAALGPVRPLWPHSRPDWLGDRLLAHLSLLDLGPESRFVEPPEGTGLANLALRRELVSAFLELEPVPTSLDGGGLSMAVAARSGRVIYEPDAAIEITVPAERLTQSWFRRRAARQAIREADSDRPTDRPSQLRRWQSIKDYLFRLPPTDWSLRGLVLEQKDPALLELQVAAIRETILALVDGIEERDDG